MLFLILRHAIQLIISQMWEKHRSLVAHWLTVPGDNVSNLGGKVLELESLLLIESYIFVIAKMKRYKIEVELNMGPLKHRLQSNAITPAVRKVQLQKIKIHSLNVGSQRNSSWRGGVDRVWGTMEIERPLFGVWCQW